VIRSQKLINTYYNATRATKYHLLDLVSLWFIMTLVVPQRIIRSGLLKKVGAQNPSTQFRGHFDAPLFTVTTLCEYLAISRATLYRLIKRGEIEPVRIGSLTRFTENEVNRYITRQQKQARSSEAGF
jgi:excisionase family DNA binding protein